MPVGRRIGFISVIIIIKITVRIIIVIVIITTMIGANTIVLITIILINGYYNPSACVKWMLQKVNRPHIAAFSCTCFSKVAVEIGDSVFCRFAAGFIGGVLGASFLGCCAEGSAAEAPPPVESEPPWYA